MILDRKDRNTWRKICLNAPLSSTNPTWSGLAVETEYLNTIEVKSSTTFLALLPLYFNNWDFKLCFLLLYVDIYCTVSAFDVDVTQYESS
jgi:hypothetical protein